MEVTAGLDSSNCPEAFRRSLEIVAELAAEGSEPAEVERARACIAGRRALSFENTTMAATHLADQAILYGRVIDPQTAIADLDAVTEDEVRRVAASMPARPATVCVGPHTADDFA